MAKKKPQKRVARNPLKKARRMGGIRRPPRRPRDQALPGLEDVRIGPLDEVCDDIYDNREVINERRDRDAVLRKKAQKLLHEYGKRSWRGAVGIDLSDGEEVLIVSRIKPSKPATRNLPPSDAGEGELDMFDGQRMSIPRTRSRLPNGPSKMEAAG